MHQYDFEIPELKINTAHGSYDLDLNNPNLPDWVMDHKMSCGDYPYDAKLSRKKYEKQLAALHIELTKCQTWLQKSGHRVICLFEGRDAAGKGGMIKRIREYQNSRHTRVVALSKPNETERGEWYYQRYIKHFPTAGEMMLFDRSWYNRAGVEKVMGFCNDDQYTHFLETTPSFERQITDEGIFLFKFWLNVGQEMQISRFHDRRHSPLKYWKLSPMDIKALTKWQEYTNARNAMFTATDTDHAPWVMIKTNDKRRGRLNGIRHLLSTLPYEGKDKDAIGEIDNNIRIQNPKSIFTT